MRDPVALLLADEDVAARAPALSGKSRSISSSSSAARAPLPRGLLEEVEELAVLRDEDLGEAGHGAASVGESGVNAVSSARSSPHLARYFAAV